MGDSSSEVESGEENYVPYKKRPEWADIQPVPQDDGPTPVVAIAYSEQFQDVYDYFRAIIKKNEKSERALQLTVDAIDLNPANYTVWQYRREILKELNKNLEEELEYVKSVISENPKNYQVWHHRRVIVEWIGKPGEELEVTAKFLQEDAKNYHAWQHRQWAIMTFRLFDNEMDYVNQLIEEDIRNNSAWNQRYFVLNHGYSFNKVLIAAEITYCMNKIKIATKNESPWNYLKGILLHTESGICEPSVLDFCHTLYKDGCRSPHLLAFLVDAAIDRLEHGDPNTAQLKENARKLLNELAEQHDRIRANYWKYIETTLDSLTVEPAKN